MRRTWPILGLVSALVLGAALRLVWVRDMEYKWDEYWTFSQTQEESRTQTDPWLGMGMSVGIPNPGMSLWIFEWPAALLRIEEPMELARVVQVSSVLALLLLAGFALWVVPAPEREPWLWATALAAVNPLAVLFQRKIWPPSLFPLLTLAMLAGWWHRQRRGGAFVWGLIGAILGQIQGAGYFFAAGFCVWAFLFDRKRVAWRAWFVGSGLGALPMLPWLRHVLTTPHEDSFSRQALHNVIEGKFWMRWFTEPFGWGLTYSLGDEFKDFLSYPIVAGQPTYFVAFLHALIVLAAGVLLVHWIMDWRKMQPAASSFFQRWIGSDSPSAFTVSAALWGFGLVMTLSALPIHRHYMIVLFFLEFLWLARIALNEGRGARGEGRGARGDLARRRFGRVFLTTLCVIQLLVTAHFLHYIHVNQGATGDYGPAYGSARNRFRPQSEFAGRSARGSQNEAPSKTDSTLETQNSSIATAGIRGQEVNTRLVFSDP